MDPNDQHEAQRNLDAIIWLIKAITVAALAIWIWQLITG